MQIKYSAIKRVSSEGEFKVFIQVIRKMFSGEVEEIPVIKRITFRANNIKFFKREILGRALELTKYEPNGEVDKIVLGLLENNYYQLVVKHLFEKRAIHIDDGYLKGVSLENYARVLGYSFFSYINVLTSKQIAKEFLLEYPESTFKACHRIFVEFLNENIDFNAMDLQATTIVNMVTAITVENYPSNKSIRAIELLNQMKLADDIVELVGVPILDSLRRIEMPSLH